MSRQQTFAPDEKETEGGKRKPKEKPWIVWRKWRKRWSRHGRYRTREEAEKAKAQIVRRYANFGHRPPRVVRALKQMHAAETFRVRHESKGKPE